MKWSPQAVPHMKTLIRTASLCLKLKHEVVFLGNQSENNTILKSVVLVQSSCCPQFPDNLPSLSLSVGSRKVAHSSETAVSMLSLWSPTFPHHVSKPFCTVRSSVLNASKPKQEIANCKRGLLNRMTTSLASTNSKNIQSPVSIASQTSVSRISSMSNILQTSQIQSKPSQQEKGEASGLPLEQIVNELNKIIPLHLAESWDNVGLLLEPSSPITVRNILLDNDLTEAVLNEAIDQGINLIISYHPPLFRPLKTLRPCNWKEKIVLRCAEERIAIFSPHTALDAIKGGVNDWLLACVSSEDIKPIQQSYQRENEAVSTEWIGYGMGRLCKLIRPVALEELIETYKKHLQLAHLRIALANNHTINTNINSIAVCAGSGASVLTGVQADLLITGEMSHHEVLDANHRGSSVILTEHSNSERGFLIKLQETMKKALGPNVHIHISQQDRDPLTVV